MSVRQRLKRLEARAADDLLSAPRTCGHTWVECRVVYPADTPLPLPPDPHGWPVCRAGEEPPMADCPECDRWHAALSRRNPGHLEIRAIEVCVPRLEASEERLP